MPATKSPALALKAAAEDATNRRMRAALDALRVAKPIAKPQHGGARPGAGRPSIEPGEETVTITIRVTLAQREKYLAIGGSTRFRAWLDRVKA